MEQTYDVIVIGYGASGGVAAIEAARLGAKVLLVEKADRPGGNTILSGGFCRVSNDATRTAAYLRELSGNRIDQTLIDTIAHGMTQVPNYLKRLAENIGASVSVAFGDDLTARQTADLYDWPGRESIGWSGISSIPDFDGYPWLPYVTRGQYLMRVIEANVDDLPIDVQMNTAAKKLLKQDGEIVGVQLDHSGRQRNVFATGGVILAAGGFAFDRQMIMDYIELPVVYGFGHTGNTGDGVRMAQAVGASLWHMWHFGGSYGVKVPDYPTAFPMSAGGGARNEDSPVGWILVDQKGQRFTNELHPAPLDTMARPFQNLDVETGTFDRVPAWLLFDEDARKLGPIVRTTSNNLEQYYPWSQDNTKEIERGWIVVGDTLTELAQKTGLPEADLAKTIARWNDQVSSGEDRDYQRPPNTMLPVAKPPFYAAHVWPVCSNTQGGPKHDAYQRVLDPFDEPIPGLYAVGELGSFFGHIYILGGNLTEALIGGQVAGKRAARGIDRKDSDVLSLTK